MVSEDSTSRVIVLPVRVLTKIRAQDRTVISKTDCHPHSPHRPFMAPRTASSSPRNWPMNPKLEPEARSKERARPRFLTNALAPGISSFLYALGDMRPHAVGWPAPRPTLVPQSDSRAAWPWLKATAPRTRTPAQQRLSSRLPIAHSAHRRFPVYPSAALCIPASCLRRGIGLFTSATETALARFRGYIFIFF